MSPYQANPGQQRCDSCPSRTAVVDPLRPGVKLPRDRLANCQCEVDYWIEEAKTGLECEACPNNANCSGDWTSLGRTRGFG